MLNLFIVCWTVWASLLMFRRPIYLFSRYAKGSFVVYPFIVFNSQLIYGRVSNPPLFSGCVNRKFPDSVNSVINKTEVHELIHFMQIKELGVIPAYAFYFIEYWVKFVVIRVYKSKVYDLILSSFGPSGLQLRYKRYRDLAVLQKYSGLFPYICTSFEAEAYLGSCASGYLEKRVRFGFFRYVFSLNLA